MNFEQLFYSFWWLIFPVFGMVFALVGMIQSEGRSRKMMELIKSYVDQGKEPPAELLRMAREPSDYEMGWSSGRSQNGNAWSFVVFAALSAGFAVGWWFVREQSFAFAFLIVAVTMGVLSIGALLILLLSRKQ